MGASPENPGGEHLDALARRVGLHEGGDLARQGRQIDALHLEVHRTGEIEKSS